MTDYTGSYNSWSFGADTNSQIISIEGAEDLPTLSPIDTQRLREHGEFYTADIAAGRDVTLELLLLPSSTIDFSTLVEQVKAATVPQASPLPLTLTLPSGRSRLLYCRPRNRSLPVDLDYSFGYGAAKVQFHANDPRWYDTTLQAVTTTPASGGAGLAMPLTFPLSFGGPVTGGAVTLTNEGNTATRPVVTINGPCTNPYLQGPNGEQLSFAITLAFGENLVIDFEAKTVVLNGSASRYSALAQPFSWWELPPGPSTVTFGASSVGAGCQATFAFRSAWF